MCGCLRIDIGADRSEQLDWQPASYFVWEHWIHKYLCPRCTGRKPAAPDTPATAVTSTEATAAMEKAARTETTTAAESADKPQAPVNAATTQEATATSSAAATLNVASIPPTETLRIVSGMPGPPIISAVKPAMPIHKGLPGPGLLAHITACKYADHLPLYRLERILSRHGIDLARSTMCDWMAHVAGMFRCVVERMADLSSF